ncbi:NUDIX hydrolase [Sphingobacterium spiritivorum]|uniref:NUDIX hydrolase n=1 Tax=Sphingobacterium spiritivorum TaxID=258 RepID=UPI0019198037|nr:NUDIX domain-containing protein [Sphingobacterium spiritivorum]QQT26611.1 NUDIX domain-containing protein [Sphingobacterium spiritivorum]
MRKLDTAGLVIVKEDSVLLAFSKNKKAWYLPGGKVDPGETAQQALIREIEEELNVSLDPDHIQYYKHIQAPAYGEDQLMMEQECFIYHSDIHPKASQEIEEVSYFDYATYRKEAIQVPGVIKLFEILKADQIIHY